MYRLVFLSFACLVPQVAFGQIYAGPYGPYTYYPGTAYGSQFVNPYYFAAPYIYGYGYRYSPYGMGATPDSAYLNGLGNAYRGWGQAQRDAATARVDNERARQIYLQNQRDALQNQRQWNDERMAFRREGEARRHAEYEKQLEAYRKWKAMKYGDSDATIRTTPKEVHPETGQINWPTVLRETQFESDRERLTNLFARRAQTGLTSDLTNAIHESVQSLRQRLVSQISRWPGEDYLEARRFLEALDTEARHAPGV